MKKKKALLIVDVQNDFCPGGALAVPGGDLIIPAVNGISGKFDLVIATKDWHPPGHVSFASTHGDRKPGDTVVLGGREQQLWPDHCVQNSTGARFHSLLDPCPINLILHKGRNRTLDSYSAFFENDGKTSTGLAGYLGELKIDTLYVCGLATDYCVFFSAIDAVNLGLEVFFLEDCSAGVDQPKGNLKRTLDGMQKAGIQTVQSGNLGA